ncbi:MAG: DUF3014 domain-containing protein [Gemmatimonadales bacterium]|nr:MAG: DUF3014 domain-containing protein [Gemmatimonadales bacterium]
MAAYSRRNTSEPPVVPIVLAIVMLLLVGGAAWFWLRSDVDRPTDWSPSDFATTDAEPEAEPPPPSGDPPPLDLPELETSDEFIRRLVSGLSAHPRLAAWLATDALIQRFVGTVVDLAGGFHPAEHVPFLRPESPFSVRESGGRTVIAEASYARYDLHAAVIQSLDTDGSVRLFRQLRPLIDEAWAERGLPGTFDDALELAIDNLLAVRVPTDPPEVVEVEGVWMFADPELESRRGAAKALLRMGPDNARRIQEKLRDVQVRLPPPPPGG